MEGRPRQSPACLGKLFLNWRVAGVQMGEMKGKLNRRVEELYLRWNRCASHRPPEQEEKGSGALARVPRGRHYPYGLESKTAPEGNSIVDILLLTTR
ncbi:hypothetical protein J6590_064588 [Homalodisca vitripennis]|nr:hypothetical protein J6590_064588 [Homalodisca vitripennis]